MTADPLAAGWSRKTLPLRISVGERYVTVLRLALLVRDTHFTALGDDLEAAVPPALPAGVDGLMIPSQPYCGEAFRIRRHGRHLLYAPRRYLRHWVDTTGGHDAYVAAFSGKTRSTLRRKVRKFAGDGAESCDFRVYRTAAELAEFHRLARPLSAATYQERLMDAGLPDSPDFLRDMAARAERDAARGYLLFRDGQPAAYTYCPVDDGIALYAYTGYDPALAALSPGTVLQWLLLEDQFADPAVRVFDFTQGEGPHKELFSTASRACIDLYVLRPTLRAWRGIAMQTAVEQAVQRVGDGLDALGLKARVRRLMRGTA